MTAQPLALPSGLVIEKNAPLKSLTSWLVGGNADYLALPRTLDDLREALAFARLMNLPVTIFGGGTNVLVSDRGVRGLTIALRKMAGIEVRKTGGGADPTAGANATAGGSIGTEPRLVIECLAGTSKSELLKTFLKNRLEPALFLAGLPGDVGGGVAMNAGIGEMLKPREFVEITDWVEVMRWKDGYAFSNASPSSAFEAVDAEKIRELASLLEVIRFDAKSLNWSYRHCEGWRPGVIVRAGLSWPDQPSDDILNRVKQANQVRLSKQPLDMPSCGSVFVNPQGHKSGQLIEGAGLKGFVIGGAKVSEKHANFIVNFNDATALDIHSVIEHVRATVLARSGVQLKTEVVYVGDWPEKARS